MRKAGIRREEKRTKLTLIETKEISGSRNCADTSFIKTLESKEQTQNDNAGNSAPKFKQPLAQHSKLQIMSKRMKMTDFGNIHVRHLPCHIYIVTTLMITSLGAPVQLRVNTKL